MPTPSPGSMSEALQGWGERFLERHREDVAVRQAFDRLVAAGCDAQTLFVHLALVSAPGERITRDQLRLVLRDLQAVAGHLRLFGQSRAGPHFDPNGEWALAHDAILRVATIVEKCHATHVGHKDEWTDKTVSDLSRYVEERTARPHHAEVDVLVNVARSRKRPIATRQRRVRSERPSRSTSPKE